ncbi:MULTISPECIES: hypothetical protein [Serratia]|uniref:hypothetical protein n=1 Tax=Serratia TaxID=613 RepID=UPI0009319003|nr:hypothetical protein [Serratia marcescens]EJC0203577.1 hypothetical protein [Serratia marcescens]MDS0826494.1 hypothetical protein [Serratia marcescens]PYA05869.1 hypothetical protein DMW43_10155 [Serratia marcescens]PYA50590.1 hypothetical protein DMW45_05035 [Serratia marcescens]QFH60819.1 hypothetical protein FR888_16785 [Serratia marcescens]
MPEWNYADDWSEQDLLNGNYCGFVYIFQFEDGTSYVGSKQIYKRVKSASKIRDNSVENGWRDYTSSSNVVNRLINEGMQYTRTILWAFPTMSETLLVETILISTEGLKANNLNLSIMHKSRLPTGDNKKRLRGIVQEILGWLN